MRQRRIEAEQKLKPKLKPKTTWHTYSVTQANKRPIAPSAAGELSFRRAFFPHIPAHRGITFAFGHKTMHIPCRGFVSTLVAYPRPSHYPPRKKKLNRLHQSVRWEFFSAFRPSTTPQDSNGYNGFGSFANHKGNTAEWPAYRGVVTRWSGV